MPDFDSFSETPGMFAGRRRTIVLRGIVAILFAMLAFAWPGEMLHVLKPLFGCYVLVEGICILIAARGGQRRRHNRWLLALEGVVGMGLGIAVLRAPVPVVPRASAVMLLYYISVWAVALGLLRIAGAMRLRKEISGEMWLPLSGVVAILFGVSLMLWPRRMGAVAMTLLIAGYALVTGIFEVLLGIDLRRSHDIALSHPKSPQRMV